MKPLLFFISFICSCPGVVLQANSLETITPLGNLGGSTFTPFRISNTGVVVGYAQTPAGDTHAFSSGASQPVQDLNATASESFAYGVNGSGQVAGVSYSGGQAHATVWSSNGSTDLGAGSYATDINASGQVSGGNGQAFLYSNGITQELGTLGGGDWSAGYGINDAGQIAGDGSTASGAFRAFVWDSAQGLKQLGTLGGKSSYATGINNSGQVVGHSNVSSGYEHAFISSGNTLTDLGTLGGGNSYAYGLNDAGVVVGSSFLAGNAVTHAFAYSGGQLIDLNSLLPSNSGWLLQEAYGINNLGDIVGVGTFNGQTTGFLLDPPRFAASSVPEPGTIELLSAGLAALAAFRLRRRRPANMSN